MIRTPSDFSLTPKAHAKKGNLYRSDGANSVIYVRFFHTVNGRKREINRSTGRTVEREARTVAWNIWQHETGHAALGQLPPTKLRSTSPKIGRIIDYIIAHRRQCTKASEKTLTGYIGVLRRAIELVSGQTNWREANLTLLNDTFVHDWRAAKYRQRGLDINKDADEDMHLNANLNKELQNMKSIFGRQAIQSYRDAGMEIPPTLSRFLNVRRLDEHNTGFIEIPTETDSRMQLCAQAAIHRARGIDYRVPVATWTIPSAEVAVAYELARFAGLTQKEIVNFRRDWIAADHSHIAVQAGSVDGRQFKTKANSKNGQIPTNPQRVRWWLEALPDTDSGYLLPGTCETHRVELCQRVANPWIATHLPDRKKRLHELRKQAGLDIYRATSSLTATAAFLRDTEPTARSYYLPKQHQAAQFGVVGL